MRGALSEVAATPLIADFTDRRLVAIYDTVNPYAAGTQSRLYLQLVAEVGAASMIDLGCGTGLITRELPGRVYRLTGVDPGAGDGRHRPAPPLRRSGGLDRRGCEPAGTPDARPALMTRHAAQFFLTHDTWHSTITAYCGRPAGWLAFERRNPGRGMGALDREARWSADDPAAWLVDNWSEVRDVGDSHRRGADPVAR